MSVQGEDKVKNMYDEVCDFFRIHVLLNHLILGIIKSIHVHLRTSRSRTIVREMNLLLVYLLVNPKSMQRMVILPMRIRDILDQIQKKNKNKI